MKYLYDEDHVRYELYQTNGGKPYNWLFIPGGPGVDSSYFRGLVDLLQLPGNSWLIDLPGNGGNRQPSQNYDHWFKLFPKVVEQFENPVIIGHSFGGMLTLLCEGLEEKLKGFVILNSSPTLWLEEAASYAQEFGLPDLTEPLTALRENPSDETFKEALSFCMPYYFPEETLEQGRELLMNIPFEYAGAAWWQQRAHETNYSAKWVPQNLPTLVVGGKYDGICPFALFEKDQRFHRPNITLELIGEGGHFPWVENPERVKQLFENYNELI